MMKELEGGPYVGMYIPGVLFFPKDRAGRQNSPII